MIVRSGTEIDADYLTKWHSGDAEFGENLNKAVVFDDAVRAVLVASMLREEYDRDARDNKNWLQFDVVLATATVSTTVDSVKIKR